jgi:hypothetical protein
LESPSDDLTIKINKNKENEENKETNEKRLKTNPNSKFKRNFIIGSLLFFFSLTGIFFIFKYKSYFHKP